MNAPDRRITHPEVAAAIGINRGELVKLRANGARMFDPSFSKQIGGTFSEDEILAWKKTRDDRGAQGNDTQSSSQSPQSPRDNRNTQDRRQQ